MLPISYTVLSRAELNDEEAAEEAAMAATPHSSDDREWDVFEGETM